MANELHLVMNAENKPSLPKNFRTYEALYTTDSGEQKLITLAVSSQFSEASLKEVMRAFPSKKIEVLNLRQEPYVFINGMACEAKCCDVDHKTLACMIPLGEPIHIHDASTKKVVETEGRQIKVEVPGEKRQYLPSEICTEEQLVRSLGLKYTFIAIENNKEDDARKAIATHETIDRVVETLKKSFEESDIIYVHCKAGKSRSPSMVVLALMLMHASTMDLDAFEAMFKHETYENRKFQQYKTSFYIPFFQFLRSQKIEKSATTFSAHLKKCAHTSHSMRQEVSR